MIKKYKSIILLTLVSTFGLLKMDASLRRKLKRGDPESRISTESRRRIPAQTGLPEEVISGRRGQLLTETASKYLIKTLSEFAQELDQVNPVEVIDKFGDETVLIKTYNVNDLPNISGEIPEEDGRTNIIVYFGKFQSGLRENYIYLPDRTEVLTKETLFSRPLSFDMQNIYGITKIEISTENRTILNKIKFLGRIRVFNILELKPVKEEIPSIGIISKKGDEIITQEFHEKLKTRTVYRYKINNTFWGGSKKTLILVGAAGIAIIGLATIALAKSQGVEVDMSLALPEPAPQPLGIEPAPQPLGIEPAPSTFEFWLDQAKKLLDANDWRQVASEKRGWNILGIFKDKIAPIFLDKYNSIPDALKSLSANDCEQLARVARK